MGAARLLRVDEIDALTALTYMLSEELLDVKNHYMSALVCLHDAGNVSSFELLNDVNCGLFSPKLDERSHGPQQCALAMTQGNKVTTYLQSQHRRMEYQGPPSAQGLCCRQRL